MSSRRICEPGNSGSRRMKARRRGGSSRGLALRVEALERRLMLEGSPVISEFMASNDSTLADEDGDFSDWIEIHNLGDSAVNLEGWSLTDDADNLDRWQFPAIELPASGYLTVFASGKDRTDPTAPLHTDFQLDSEGEYLGLVEPGGSSVAHDFAPSYPPQLPDVSYGLFAPLSVSPLVASGASAKILAPRQPEDVAAGWTGAEFDDSSWPLSDRGREGPLPVGYEVGSQQVIPTDGLQLWLRADQGVVTVNNLARGGTAADVTRWIDQSGLHHDAVQTVTAFQPALINDALNGQPILRFNQDYFSDVTVGSVGNEFSFFAVMKATPTGQYHNVFERTSAVRPMLWIRNTNEYEFNFSETAGGIQAGVIDNTWDVIGGVVRNSGIGQSFYLNGPRASDTSNTGFSVPAGNSAYRLFNRNGGQSYQGDFAELVIYNDALTNQEVDQIGGYLQEKYGIDGSFTVPSIDSQIATDVEALMYQQTSSLLVRHSFDAPPPETLDRLQLEIRYDDGFAAYLNGVEVARRNAPGVPGALLSYNDAASGFHSSLVPETIDLSPLLDLLQPESNVLAIHGLNFVAADSDFFLGVALTGFDVTPLSPSSSAGYFRAPTPGGLNGVDAADQGPLISAVSHSPQQPAAGENLVVAAQVVDPALDSVSLHYRVMFADEQQLEMTDDGQGADVVAGDGFYTAEIPGNAYSVNQMVRYYVTADNAGARTSRWPLFPDPRRSDEYLGTVARDPALTSPLRVLHWFVEDTTGADDVNRSGARAALYFAGEFYDNVFSRVRGASSALEPKKPYKFDFHPGHFFRYRDDRPRVEEINVNTTFQDKAYLRTVLAHETVAEMGVPSSDAENLRVQRNGQFFSVAVFVEQVDAIFLERNGLDPDGALYKMFNGITAATAGVEKKTRLDEDQSDLQSLVDGLSPANPNRSQYVFDNIDLPAAINYATSGIIIQDFDRGAKNFYVYRDTNGGGEWTQIPWDFDLTFGNRFYSDEISGNGGRGHGIRSHPFWGESEHNLFGTNMMIDALIDNPVTREMYVRRLRTLMDQFLQPPDTPREQLLYEQRIDQMVALLQDDAALDLATWGAIYGVVRDLPTAVELLKTNYLAERRVYLYETQAAGNMEPARTLISGSPGVTPAQYFVPTDHSLGTAWTTPAYLPGPEWSTGFTGVGYETAAADYQNLISSTIQPNLVCEDCTSLLVRVPFSVEDVDQIERLTLRMKYDDGFVAYINGQEVARNNVSATPVAASPPYNAIADLHDDAAAVIFENFDISAAASLLQPGANNILAIHAVNAAITSSDMLVLPELVVGAITDSDSAGIPAAQPDFATMPAEQRGIQFGSIEFAPASGDQEQEYVEIVNNNDFAIDISGWKLRDAVRLTFKAGTVIPSHSSLYASPDVTAFRSRAAGPGGGQSFFVQGNYEGHLSSLGETITLLDDAGEEIASQTYAGDPSALQSHLRISEINYNPPPPTDEELAVMPAVNNDSFEFMEFVNTSPDPLNLQGVQVTSGVVATFGEVTLQSGQLGVLVKDAAAFLFRYGGDILVLGEFTSGSLNNGGEIIKIEDPHDNTIQEFGYDDEGAWPKLADGRGATLESIDYDGDYSAASNWRDSREYAGSPGQLGSGPLAGVVVNEVLTHTDPPQSDAVELFNTTDQAIDISGWLLSDSSDELFKYQFPGGVTLPAGGYLAIDEQDFNASMGLDARDFALDGAHGDQLFLMETDAAGKLLAFADHVEFDASANGETLGRWPNGTGTLYPMLSATLAAQNSGPRIGPLLISELMYHPIDPGPGIDPDDLEFVEIFNPTGQVVDLTHWELSGGVEFSFPPGATIDESEALVILSFDPADPLNSVLLDQFLAHYGLDESVRLVGAYAGKLDNGGERVRLSRPDEPPALEPQFYPSLLEDEANYADAPPWPAAADGEGASLSRVLPADWGHAATSWIADSPSPGSIPAIGPPRVVSVDLHRNLADPDDLAAGPQPTTWKNQRSDLTSISIVFSEPVLLATGDLVLTNLGVDAPAEADVPIPIDADQLQETNNVWTISFEPGALADGVYQLKIRSSVTDGEGNLLDGNGDGAPGDDFLVEGDRENRFYRLTGDWNGDLGVSIFDFPVFAYWFGSAVPTAPAYVDLNADDGISIFDFPFFARNFGNSVTFPAGFATESPAGVLAARRGVSVNRESNEVRADQRPRAQPNREFFAVRPRRRTNLEAGSQFGEPAEWDLELEPILDEIGDDVSRGWLSPGAALQPRRNA